MIVKNEAKNIERALGWAKSVAYEQIVVDTGSTDDTVKLAEKLGAKVYHFQWVDDFSAARNFSIKQATGNWIIISDADEYMTPEDSESVIDLLRNMQADPEMHENSFAIGCPLVNVDENGEAMSVYSTIRVIRNNSSLRYIGRIHERLDIDKNSVIWTDEFKVIHTGYSESSIIESGKIERNIKMLREEIALNPNDLALKIYLADNLKFLNDKESQAEADEYFAEAINSGAERVFYVLRIKAYIHFLNKYVNDPERRDECESLCNKALNEFPNSLDFEYFMASVLNYNGDYQAAWDMLKAGEKRLTTGENTGVSHYVKVNPAMLYGQLLLAAQGLGNVNESIKYAALYLKTNKYEPDILSPYIFALQNRGTAGDELLILLGSIYNLGNPNDLMFIARAAKDCGATEFSRMIVTIAEEMLDN